MQLQSDEMGPHFIFQWKSRSGGRGGVGGSPNHRFEIRLIFQQSGLGGRGRGLFQEQWASKLQIPIQPLQWGRNKHWTKNMKIHFLLHNASYNSTNWPTYMQMLRTQVLKEQIVSRWPAKIPWQLQIRRSYKFGASTKRRSSTTATDTTISIESTLTGESD